MNSRDVVLLGYKLMAEHVDYDWVFLLDQSKVRFGICRYSQRVISLSEPLCNLNEEEEVRDTILHEIAHALAGSSAGHGWKWKQIARRIGCNGNRCYSAKTVKTPDKKISMECTECSGMWKRHKRIPKNKIYSCGRCYRDKGLKVALICYASFAEREKILNERQILA